MNKLLLLLKTYGKIYLGSIARKGNKKEVLSGGTLVLIISAIFIVLFTSMSISTIEQFLQLDPPQPEFALYLLTSTGIIFILLIVLIKGTNFKKSMDHDLLLSLPSSNTMQESGDVFEGTKMIIEKKTGLVYRKEQFSPPRKPLFFQ